MFVMFADDTVVYPRESEWFGELEIDGSVTPMEKTDLYKQDTIGLKKLNEAGRVQLISWPGQHLEMSDALIDKDLIPFLMS